MKLNTEHRTRRLSVAALVTATALHVSAVLASDAPPQASIQQAKGHQIMLTVTGSPGQMYTLQMATNLTGWSFVTGGVVPDQMDLSNLDSGWTNSPAAFFRAIPTDASDSSLEGCDYRPAPQWFVYLSGAPMPLVAWVALDLGVCIIDSGGNRGPFSGYADFSLRGPDYQPVPFSYTFSPPGLNISNGVGQARVTLNTTGNLSTAHIHLVPGVAPGIHTKDSPTLNSLLSSPDNFQGSIPDDVLAVLTDPNIPESGRKDALFAKLLQLRTSYTSSASAWTYPLTNALDPSDAFGSHRLGHDVPYPAVGRLHAGVDLPALHGAPVKAARNGMITTWHHLGPASSSAGADQVLVDHGNGTWTRYLHVTLNSNKRIYDRVTAGENFATVGITSGPHLHFDLCYDPSITDALVASKPDYYFFAITNPPVALTNAADLRFTAGVANRLFPSTTTTAPAITNMIITHQKPWEEHVPLAKSAPQATTPAGPRYVIAQIVDWKGPYTLPPRGILFESDSNAPVNLVFDRYLPGNANTSARYLPYLHKTADKSGLARYPLPPPDYAQVIPTTRPYRYRYWFAWDPSAYSLTNAGPRSFRIIATNNYGITATQQFTFGPQIKGSLIVPGPLGGQQFMFTNVAYLGTNLVANPSLPNFSQPDQYLLQIINTTNGLPLTDDLKWSPALSSSSHSSVFTVHTNEQVYKFTLPPNFNPGGLKLRVSSLLVTNIAHEVCFCAAAAMALIPAGSFTMGNCMDPGEGSSDELPLHTVNVSAFYMDKNPVTKGLWDAVYQWATTRPVGMRYSFEYGAQGKASNHPAQSMTWYDCVKWCNARSEMEGRVPAYYTEAGQANVYRSGQINVQNGWVKWSTGYRLPTEAEWEKAARGPASGHRFPWGDTISWGQANYYALPLSAGGWAYDVNATEGYNPAWTSGGYPYTTAVETFAPNGYGLYDMAGNVWQWCWDSWDGAYYSSSPGTDPRGPATGSFRVYRGGCWFSYADLCRSAFRDGDDPGYRGSDLGFRVALVPVP